MNNKLKKYIVNVCLFFVIQHEMMRTMNLIRKQSPYIDYEFKKMENIVYGTASLMMIIFILFLIKP
jgi:hypothetical protein